MRPLLLHKIPLLMNIRVAFVSGAVINMNVQASLWQGMESSGYTPGSEKRVTMNYLLISQNSTLELEMVPINHTPVPLTLVPSTLLVYSSPTED